MKQAILLKSVKFFPPAGDLKSLGDYVIAKPGETVSVLDSTQAGCKAHRVKYKDRINWIHESYLEIEKDPCANTSPK